VKYRKIVSAGHNFRQFICRDELIKIQLISRILIKILTLEENMKFKHGLKLFFLFCFFPFISFAAANAIPVLKAVSGQTVCASSTINLNEKINAELCVSMSAGFSHDEYVLKFNDTKIVQGIDDETTEGISSPYKEKPILLKCVAQEIGPNATAKDVRKSAPTFSNAEVNEMVKKMKGASTGIEVGRLCSVTADKKPVMKVQVLFE
jgi:hypothetical protein